MGGHKKSVIISTGNFSSIIPIIITSTKRYLTNQNSTEFIKIWVAIIRFFYVLKNIKMKRFRARIFKEPAYWQNIV